MTDFEEWAKSILGDNPNWKESGDGELARQAYAAGRAAALEDAAKEVEEVHEFYGVAPAETIRGMK